MDYVSLTRHISVSRLNNILIQQKCSQFNLKNIIKTYYLPRFIMLKKYHNSGVEAKYKFRSGFRCVRVTPIFDSCLWKKCFYFRSKPQYKIRWYYVLKRLVVTKRDWPLSPRHNLSLYKLPNRLSRFFLSGMPKNDIRLNTLSPLHIVYARAL